MEKKKKRKDIYKGLKDNKGGIQLKIERQILEPKQKNDASSYF